jgi:uncharacterized membrane protein
MFISFKNKKLGLALLCHRQEDKCLKILGRSLLCARCFGICIGVPITYLILLMNIRVPILVSILFVLPLLFDGFSQLFGLRESNNLLRLLTGMLCSVGLLSLLQQG